jgi:hypothetical protein
MYRELLSLRQALSTKLKANLPPAVPGVDLEHLLQSYLDCLTMYVGCEVADQFLTFFAVDTAGDGLGLTLTAPPPIAQAVSYRVTRPCLARHSSRRNV